MIDKIKILIGNDVNEALIDIYIDRASSSILSYLNNDKFTKEYIITHHEAALILMVENSFRSNDDKFIKSMSQGKRSVTYSSALGNIFPDEVKRLLPTPFIRMM